MLVGPGVIIPTLRSKHCRKLDLLLEGFLLTTNTNSLGAVDGLRHGVLNNQNLLTNRPKVERPKQLKRHLVKRTCTLPA
jgi:hypothetical protein